jgi:signal transduction histidine kinase/DNA-binding response OmpR family regulator
MSTGTRSPTGAAQEDHATLMAREVKVAREASRITARLVVQQFAKMEEINKLIDDKARVERQLRLRLGDELRDAEARERDLAEARRAADAANRAKSTFLANMSHELRTPLNAIIGYSELLQEEVADRGLDGLSPDLEKIRAAGKHLLTLINEILDLSKIEAGKSELLHEWFEVTPTVEEVVTTVRPLVERNHNRFVVEIASDVGAMYADVVRVRQCLFNLLSNACKFTDRGEVGLRVTREQIGRRPHLVFDVSDTGIGMTPEQLAQLFQPFHQADASTTRKYGGTGLGLTITRKLAEMMGGEISVESVAGRGSRFTMRLPVSPEKATSASAAETELAEAVGTAAADAGEETPADDRRTVLAIDDEQSVLEWMRRALTAGGFHVVTATTGKEGLALARRLHPAVIVLDVVMPGKDGWAVLAELKADPELADIPVVMATVVEERNMGFALGVADYLTKPIDRSRLLAVLGRFCGSREQPVLVVDDDPPTREALRRTLEREGWWVVEAENGRVALQRVAAAPPSVILLDLLMPEMDGFEFVEVLHQTGAHRDIPIVVVTSKDLTQHDRERLSRHVRRILQKGTYSRADLVSEVSRLAAVQAEQRAAEEEVAARDAEKATEGD